MIQPLIQDAPTYDEPTKIAAAYSFIKEHFPHYDLENPPISKLFFYIPLLFQKPAIPLPNNIEKKGATNHFKQQFRFGNKFFFENTVPAKKLLLYPRIIAFLLYFISGICLILFISKYADYTVCILAGMFYFLCPTIASAGYIATNDIFTLLFTLIFLHTLIIFFNDPNIKNTIFTGLSLGVAICTKYSLLIFIFLFCICILILTFRKILTLKQSFIYSLIVFFIIGRVIEAVYLFISPKIIFNLLKIATLYMKTGAKAYLLGKYSDHGFSSYYPITFLLKTPIPIIICIFYSIYIFFKEKKYKNNVLLILFISIFLFTAGTINAKLNRGHRYILPVYMMFYMFTPLVLAKKKWIIKKAIVPIGALLILSNILIHPHYLSYCNLLIGKNVNAYKYFADSSIDWGQNLSYLAKYLKKEGSPELILSYFGTCSPSFYDLSYQNLVSNGLDQAMEPDLYKHINSDNPSKEFIAVSATCLIGVDYPDHRWLSFLQNYSPIKIIGNTIFVYDITNSIDIHKKIALVYLSEKRIKHFLRSGRRILFLEKNNAFGKMAKALSILLYENNLINAEKELKNFTLTDMYNNDDKKLLSAAISLYSNALLQQKKHNPALKYLNMLTKVSSKKDLHRIYNSIGVTHMRMENYELSEEYFNKSITNKYDYASAYSNLAILYRRQNNFTKAKEMHDKATNFKQKSIF